MPEIPDDGYIGSFSSLEKAIEAVAAYMPCAAGRTIVRSGDPDWTEHCPRDVTEMLIMQDDETGGPDRRFMLCDHHIRQLPYTHRGSLSELN